MAKLNHYDLLAHFHFYASKRDWRKLANAIQQKKAMEFLKEFHKKTTKGK